MGDTNTEYGVLVQIDTNGQDLAGMEETIAQNDPNGTHQMSNIENAFHNLNMGGNSPPFDQSLIVTLL